MEVHAEDGTAQPISWPMLRDTTPSYVDVKIYNVNEILFHWIFRGYRADTDMSVQQQFADEFFVRSTNRGRPRLSVVIAAFSAWKVSVFLFKCGGPTYWVGPGGTVMSAESARSRWEPRVSDRASTDAVGNDAGRVWSSATTMPTTRWTSSALALPSLALG